MLVTQLKDQLNYPWNRGRGQQSGCSALVASMTPAVTSAWPSRCSGSWPLLSIELPQIKVILTKKKITYLPFLLW